MDNAQTLLTTLVSDGKLAQQTADEIRQKAIESGRTIEDLLLSQHIVSEEEIFQAKAAFYRVSYISLLGRSISQEILSFLPESVARKHAVIPFELDKANQQLSVAMENPVDLPLLEFLEQKSGKTILPYLAKRAEILEKIEEEYSKGLTADVTEALKETTPTATKSVDSRQIGQIIKEAPVAKIVSTILEYAMKSRASDVHIEPQPLRTRVRYRIDGILQEKLALPKTVHDAVISRIKILSAMKIDEKRIPQDGRFTFKNADEEVDLRVSTLPTVNGEKIVMRLLKKSGGVPTLTDLGMNGTTLATIEGAILRPHGIILVTGPTGSGKTTTLYAILSKLNTLKVNIMTIEDPVEYEITGINQVQVNPAAGLTFASGLRSFLRQDPNIILVGEIRDSDTTALAIQAALTGHLVFSTLHTNNASTAIPRLLDLGAEPFLVVSVLNAVEAQRIIRKICTGCKTSYTPTPEIIAEMKLTLGPLWTYADAPKLYKGNGCTLCEQTGYVGRIGIFETVSITPRIARLILERSTAEIIEKQARVEGMISLKQDGYLKALAGLTTLEEILRVAQE